jgi:hypothetical protein
MKSSAVVPISLLRLTPHSQMELGDARVEMFRGDADGGLRCANREVGVPRNGARRCVGPEKELRKIMDCRDYLNWTLWVAAGKVNMPIISLT